MKKKPKEQQTPQQSIGTPGGAYEEYPVSVRRFVQEENYLGLGNSVYPKIQDTLSAIFRGRYEEAVLCWGIGSGKSFLCALALTYMAYRTLCLRNPQRYYGLAEDSPIHLVNVGPTARLAEKVVFAHIRRLVNNSYWFREFYPPDNRVRTELHFPKNVIILPGNSSETFPLGLNVLCAVMDEASFFVETLDGEREAAEDVYLALQRRIKSRFGSRGLMLIASSPRHCEDFIMRKLREAETNPAIFASQKATWEIKAAKCFCGRKFEYKGWRIPIEFERDFRQNPEKALRDLAAAPGPAFQAFFVDLTALEEAAGLPLGTVTGPQALPPNSSCSAQLTDEKPLKAESVAALSAPAATHTEAPRQEIPERATPLRHPFEEGDRLADWFRPADRAPRYIHVDLGLKKDACGIAMAKVVSEQGRPVAIVELMQQLKARPGEEINLSYVRELILNLRRRGFPIAQVSYDGWQSADSQQILRRQGINVATVSVDRDLTAYETLKELLYDKRLRLYYYKPFFEECRRLELIKGVKVDHPPGGSKDVADAVAGAVSEAIRAWGGADVKSRIV